MKQDKKYSIKSPMGTMLVPKNEMNEAEIRDFTSQLADPDVDNAADWQEKIEKDPIAQVIQYRT